MRKYHAEYVVVLNGKIEGKASLISSAPAEEAKDLFDELLAQGGELYVKVKGRNRHATH